MLYDAKKRSGLADFGGEELKVTWEKDSVPEGGRGCNTRHLHEENLKEGLYKILWSVSM